MSREAVQLSIQKLLAVTASRPAVDHAVKSLLWRISTHQHQRDSANVYIELSIGYLQKVSMVSFGSANTAWHLVKSHVGWNSIHKNSVNDYGFNVRKISKNQKWGQHLIFDPSVYDAVVEFSNWMVTSDIWYPPGIAVSDGTEWKPIQVLSSGTRNMARCQWHDDSNPSMIVNINDDDKDTGYGVCMACKTDSGRNFSVFMRRVMGDSWEGRPSASSRLSLRKPVTSKSHKALDGIHNPLGSGSPGRVVLARLGSNGLIGSYGRNDVISTLKWANRAGDAAEKRAWTASAKMEVSTSDIPTEFLPDRLISVSEMVASEWSSIPSGDGEIYIPKRFKPTRQKWILIDLDDFTRLSLCIHKKSIHQFIDRMVSDEPSMSGRFAIVRTSYSGVQIWLELNRHYDPAEYFNGYKNRSFLAGLGKAISSNLRSYGCEGGHVDHSAFAPGRFGRRPGWRLLSDGMPFRSSLVGYSNDRT